MVKYSKKYCTAFTKKKVRKVINLNYDNLGFLNYYHLISKRYDIKKTPLTNWKGFHWEMKKIPGSNKIFNPRLYIAFREGKVDFVEFIASIMDNKGWHIAAAFQRIWVRGKANQVVGHVREGKGSFGQLRVETIPMKWIMKFERGRNLFLKVTNSKVFANQAARKKLIQKLEEKFKKTGKTHIAFGDFHKKGRALEKEYINQRTSEKYVKIDGLTAALGRFVMCVIPQGTATKNNGETVVIIERTGAFIRDSFDFNNYQDLGRWAWPDKVDVSILGPDDNYLDYVQASNKTYRAILSNSITSYSSDPLKFSVGGDFVIYSDVLVNDKGGKLTFRY